MSMYVIIGQVSTPSRALLPNFLGVVRIASGEEIHELLENMTLNSQAAVPYTVKFRRS